MSGSAEVAGRAEAPVSRFRIFRASDAGVLDDHNMPHAQLTPTDEAGMAKASAEGAFDGAMAKVLFADPVSGMSVGFGWFKPGFVLPRHSHDADCAYMVISGEAHLGTEVLRPGDGFFIPAGHNYQYTAGPDGVEVVEFRNAAQFDIRLAGNSEAAWRRITEAAVANRERWRTMTPPTVAGRMLGAD